MEIFIVFITFYVTIFVFLFLFYYLIKKKRNTLGLNRALKMIVSKYDLTMNRKRVLTLSKILVVINSLILAIPLTIAWVVEINYYLCLLISFIIFIILIFCLYNLVGYYLRKKGW